MHLSQSISIEVGDYIQLLDSRGKKYIQKLYPNSKLQTNQGTIILSDLVGLPWGSRVKTHLGKEFLLVQPSLSDLLTSYKRTTSIMYPKDIGFVLMNMNICEGTKVIEAGTGSGALTTAFCWAVGSTGHVYSYDNRRENQELAKKNINLIGFSERVTFKYKDIGDGFDETGIDAMFLDIPDPENYLKQVKVALKSGGFFGNLVPTTNQLSRLAEALVANDFAFIDICEIMLRYYKTIPARLRPDDRMTAHTGFLTFARPIT
jgi:tRNA (adenine57-N1/adenine58-N1)-methyltransferase